MENGGENFVSLNSPPLLETVLCLTLKRSFWCREEVQRLSKQIVPDFVPHGEFKNEKVICKTGGAPQIETVNEYGGAQFVKNSNLVLALRNHSAQGEVVVFAFSILRPYVSWKDFLEQVAPVYQKFKSAIGDDVPVARIGLRSINRVLCPQEACRLSDVIRTVPQDIAGLGQAQVYDFVYRDTQYYSDYGLYATVSRSNGPMVEGHRSVILDSDVFCLSEGTLASVNLENLLVGMHNLRNKIFFGSIGEASLKGCQI